MLKENKYNISNEQVLYNADKNNPPVLKIHSGDVVTFECIDAFNQVIQKSTDLPININFERVNPVTGPVYIIEAKPNDTLEVHIEKIIPAKQGACCIIPNFGFLASKFQKPWTKIMPIKNGYAQFNERIKIPIKPFPGTILVAPKEGKQGTLVPKEYGGNMDTKVIQEGSILYLPVFVEGALFCVGDAHAAQGDGEVCGTAIEIDAKITIKFVVNKKRKIERPQIETSDCFMTTAFGTTVEEAIKTALNDMIDWLALEKNLSKEDAYALCSCIGDVQLSQLVDITPGVRISIPKSIFSLK